MATKQHIFRNAANPSAAPTETGHHWINTTTGAMFISTGIATVADWQQIPGFSDAIVDGELVKAPTQNAVFDALALKADSSGLSTVATSGDHDDLSNIGTNTHAQIDTHIADTANPHAVTKTQVGLGNADNTSDLDKPISNATSTALSGKANTAHTHPLSDLTQSSATPGQVPEWSGTAWVPATPSVGGGVWGSITGSIDDQTDLNEKFSDYVNRGAEYYLTSTSSDQGGGRLEMITSVPSGGGFGISNSSVANAAVLADFASVDGYPNITHIPSGVMTVRVQARQTAGTKVSKLYAEFYTRTNPGGVNTTHATTGLSEVLTGSNAEMKFEIVTPVIAGLLVTDRLGVRIIADVTGAGTDPDITIDIQGVNYSRVSIPSYQVHLGTLLDGKQDIIDGVLGNNKVVGTNGSGVVAAVPSLTVNSNGAVDSSTTVQPNNNSGGFVVSTNQFNIDPLQNSPNDTWNLVNNNIALDINSSGFTFGTAGNSARIVANNFSHQGTGNVGAISFTDNNFNLGNGTDPIDVKGVGYSFGFGTINANVNISGTLQGYGFQINANAAATISSSTNVAGFYDFANFGCAVPNYTTFAASPSLASLLNNSNYTGLNISPTVTAFTGNASVNGISVSGTYGTMNSGSGWQGLNINPTITSARYAAGLNVVMDNVTPYAGVQSVLVEQDLTFTFTNVGDNNNYTLEYTSGGTAGSEVVTILGQAITIQIDSGVSTATQIKAAADGSPMASAITTTISGVGSNTQTTFGPDNFINGENPGNIKAAYLDGDVEITGGLTFGGALSIGQLNAFQSQAMVDGGGQPASIHSLITSPTVAANVTLTSADTIAVNTAALINIGANAVVGTSFIGVAALGLPAVLTMDTGSTLDRCYGALFALSLDAGAGGGTVDEVGLCKSVAIPNGVTTVNNLYGYLFDLPFGDPGTTTWGFYDRPGKHNYFAGDLLIGGTAGSDDTVTNSSVALEIKSVTKAVVTSRMTTTERNALTAVNGMVLYNTTTDKLQVYAAATWVDLH